MPTTTPFSDAEIAGTAREAAGMVLAHPIAPLLTSATVEVLASIATREPACVSSAEAQWLRRCIDVLVEAEVALGREVPA